MTPSLLNIRPFQIEDFDIVREIYQQGIDTKNATFETEAPDWTNWDKKFLPSLRLVSCIDNKVIGWAALSAVSSRAVYAGVCEVSLYIHSHHHGKGVGKSLLSALINLSEKSNIWTLQAGIFPENIASIKIHKELGFREVGYREKIGKMDNQWRDNLFLERRSTIAGI